MYTKEEISKLLGHPIDDIIILPEVDSTNNYIKEHINKLGDKTIVLAKKQTAGRGRRGRSFLSPAGGLYLSILLKPEKLSFESSVPTVASAVTVSRALKKVCSIESEIKWVNDIYISQKKLCGILCESSNTDGYLIIGIGMNILTPPGGFPEEIADIACSLSQFTDKLDLSCLIAEIYNSIMDFSPEFHPSDFIGEYKKRSCVIGKDIVIIQNDKTIPARALNITDNAGLLVEHLDKKQEILFYGDISIRI